MHYEKNKSRFLKVGQVSTKADPEAQKIFLKTQLQPRIDEAEKLNIELLFLPTYSPNLNLIERLWCLVKKIEA